MKNIKIITLGLISLSLSIIVGCAKENYKTIPTNVNKPNNQTMTNTPKNNQKIAITNTATTKTNNIPADKPIPKTKVSNEKIKEEIKKEDIKENEKKEVKPIPQPMTVSLPAFPYGGNIPAEYTCKGNNINPQINISNIPDGTKSIAIIMDDPDAPAGTWDHWILFNIDPKTTVISKNSVPTGAKQGYNSWGNKSYGGPCPPSGTHRYFIKVYALNDTLSENSYNKNSLINAMNGKVLKEVSTMGKFSK